MALWKPFLGNRTALDSVEKHAGYVYWCVDDGSLHFDYIDANGNLQRKQINAKDAESLGSHTADEFLLEDDIDTILSQAKASGEFDGEDGYTPVRGTDYWTDADKAEIKAYVDEAILNGAW